MIYLNSASTSKPDKKVLEDFMWCAENYWHNPSDVSQPGINTKNIIKNAQEQIAASINANPEEIIFTSGGSESNNWAIKGFLDKYTGVKTIITTEIEHPSVYNTCQYLIKKGYEVIYVPVDMYGRVDVYELEEIISEHLFSFVSIMMSNNEIGSINPIKEISNVVHKYGGVLHVDAVQAFMHVPIDVEELGIDLMSTSFHKFGGLKGCGFLYIKNGVELSSLIHGGHQFDSKRAGTENVSMIYAMGNQVDRLSSDLNTYTDKIASVSDYMIHQVYDKCYDYCNVYLNGHPTKRLSNNLSFTFNGINASNLITLLEMKDIYVSAGSACSAGTPEPSRVLKAIGLTDEEAFSTIRVSISSDITVTNVDEFVDILVECIQSLQILQTN